ncbi:unnamed protein product [Paramecium sonneborni]|uniref:Uncharacterized protein n=1 Tax=Paramecium sonneborni TaxID=65129 RepID=A0A8S1RMX1_9CILI|nr:unnamed protein product [Paramecium sonneborni]
MGQKEKNFNNLDKNKIEIIVNQKMKPQIKLFCIFQFQIEKKGCFSKLKPLRLSSFQVVGQAIWFYFTNFFLKKIRIKGYKQISLLTSNLPDSIKQIQQTWIMQVDDCLRKQIFNRQNPFFYMKDHAIKQPVDCNLNQMIFQDWKGIIFFEYYKKIKISLSRNQEIVPQFIQIDGNQVKLKNLLNLLIPLFLRKLFQVMLPVQRNINQFLKIKSAKEINYNVKFQEKNIVEICNVIDVKQNLNILTTCNFAQITSPQKELS